MPKLSIVIPVLDEAELIEASLTRLAPLRARGVEVIVADGGSSDDTVLLARPLADLVIAARRGRASQMNAGAQRARAEVVLFLHADCIVPANADTLVSSALAGSAHAWGRFDVALRGRHPALPVIAALMNARSRLSGICTGDQAIFVTRTAFAAVGGFPAIALMEDIAISKALKRIGRPLCLRHKVCASGRRWERQGALRTIMLMWRLRLAYFLGADPRRLAAIYEGKPAAPRKAPSGEGSTRGQEATGATSDS